MCFFLFDVVQGVGVVVVVVVVVVVTARKSNK